jgi:uncharacterized protein YebE (UPF0316 family)
MLMDIAVVLYFRFIGKDRSVPASIDSFFLTLLPMLVTKVFPIPCIISYALGAAVGTFIGMKIKL